MSLDIHPCPHAMENAIYQTCPRLVHGWGDDYCDSCILKPQEHEEKIVAVYLRRREWETVIGHLDDTCSPYTRTIRQHMINYDQGRV